MLFEQFGTWQVLAWQHLAAPSRMVNEDGFNYYSLLQVSGREPLVNILIGVFAPSLIVARILNELKPGNAHLIEALVIGRTGRAHAHSRYTQVFEWRDPLLENWNNRRIVFGIDPQKLAAIIIEIEVTGNQRVFRFQS